jgi:hypothetical protein
MTGSAKQSSDDDAGWIASSQVLLAMTVVTAATATGRCDLSQPRSNRSRHFAAAKAVFQIRHQG